MEIWKGHQLFEIPLFYFQSKILSDISTRINHGIASSNTCILHIYTSRSPSILVGNTFKDIKNYYDFYDSTQNYPVFSKIINSLEGRRVREFLIFEWNRGWFPVIFAIVIKQSDSVIPLFYKQ